MKHSWMLMVLVIALCCNSAEAQEAKKEKASKEQQNKTTSYWMKAKMEYSTHILAGMATADFDKVAKNADQMRKLSKVEGFIRKNNTEYRKQLNDFDRILKELLAASRKKDIEAVAGQYGKLTMSCVRCHQVLRKIDGK